MGHAAIVQAVCIHERRLEFGPETPEGVAVLAAACMSRDPAARPTFDDILEILEPLGAALAAAGAGDVSGGGADAVGGGDVVEAAAAPLVDSHAAAA